MKNFNRSNQLFSLCGLNCGLCPMNIDKYCPGCGGGAGNQSCLIAKCSHQHNDVEYCCHCSKFICEKYSNLGDFDSFITYQNRQRDFKKFLDIGESLYNQEQSKKKDILNYLIKNCNDGRRKSYFCLAVNLLDLEHLESVIQKIKKEKSIAQLSIKEKAVYAVNIIEKAAFLQGITLKLNRKPKQNRNR